MCGIVGYIGQSATKKLLEKLRCLEYRGYDSSGIAGLKSGEIKVKKSLGNISNLEKILGQDDDIDYGIAHTRWATNGDVSIQNAHPHISFDGNWALVHNGIIENADKLREGLVKHGISFVGQTDSEVVVNLLAIEKGKTIERIYNVCKKLKGSWAFAVINKNESNKIFIAKKSSPLYFSFSPSCVCVASDPCCFEGRVYFDLKDDSIGEVSLGKNTIYDRSFKKVIAKRHVLKEKEEASKEDYKYFMLKEINETKPALDKLIKLYSDKKIFSKIDRSFLQGIKSIKIIGCGTAYNSGLIGGQYLEKTLDIESSGFIASEFRYSCPIINKNTLCIFVSQSGETADTLGCLSLAKQRKAKVISLTNVMYSSLAGQSKNVLPISAGKEVAVASTKAYTCQLAVFYLLSAYLKDIKENSRLNYARAINNLRHVLKVIDSIDFSELEALSEDLKNAGNVFFLGRGLDYFTALEASLKLKEVSYINSNAYPTGELKHGYLALIEKDVPVIVFATQKNLLDKTINGINEIHSRGGKVILITPFEIDLTGNNIKIVRIDNSVFLQKELYPLISIIYAQYLAFFTSIKKGINPDQPRNLAKSVTVE